MISLIFSLILTNSHASVCRKVLLSDTAKAMHIELETLKLEAKALSNLSLLNHLEIIKKEKGSTELVQFLGTSLIPMSLDLMSVRDNQFLDAHQPFVDEWNENVWAFVLINEFQDRLRK